MSRQGMAMMYIFELFRFFFLLMSTVINVQVLIMYTFIKTVITNI